MVKRFYGVYVIRKDNLTGRLLGTVLASSPKQAASIYVRRRKTKAGSLRVYPVRFKIRTGRGTRTLKDYSLGSNTQVVNIWGK